MRLDLNAPAPRPGERLDFWTPVNKQPEPVIFLSRGIHSHAIHYDKRTVPCVLVTDELGNITERCPHCDQGTLPRRWRGYLHVYRVHAGVQVFLCLPPGAGHVLQNTYGVNFDYRGLMGTVSRVSGQKNKPLVVAINTLLDRRKEIPEELDPSPFLDTVFRIKRALPNS